MASFIKSDSHLTLVFDDGDSVTVYNSNENYAGVCEAVKNKDWELAKTLAMPVEAIKKSIQGIDKIAIEGGFVTYNGIPMHGTLTERMLDMYNSGFDILPMALFLENLMENPSHRAVNELYDFLEASDLPITEDGHFLAYKRVNEDFMDIYTGKIDNSPGAFVEMPRNMVDEDKSRTCSNGLHFCSRDYLPSYGSYGNKKVVMVKINPRDVVAIPSDYNNAKGRCCAYNVVRELPIDFESKGNMPEENLEGSYRETESRTVVSETTVEQLDLAASIHDGDPIVIKMFDSPTIAMHQTDIDSSSITKVCDGIRRSAGGYGWRWAKDNPNCYIPDDSSKQSSGYDSWYDDIDDLDNGINDYR